ncbi:dienelactone hydrolase family protein [Streptomyces sp. NPDC002845]
MISEMVSVPADRVTLTGDFVVPASARAIVVFAHGVDRSRQSSYSGTVAARLHSAGFGTLLVDLLSEHEEPRDALTDVQRFDTALLGHRLVATVDWVKAQPDTRNLPVVLFGTGTEAAAVLEAAAELPDRVLTAVVWGGRPDLAGDALGRVRIPVLLIAGGQDPEVLRLSEKAAQRLGAACSVRVVPEATHRFEEPGVLEEVVSMAEEWCDERLRALGEADGE